MEDEDGYFGERVAATYDGTSGVFGPGAVEATAGVLAGLADGGRVLELGIGTGRIALPLARRGVEVHGIDLSRAMVARLRAKPGGEAIPVAIGGFATTTMDGTFDLMAQLAGMRLRDRWEDWNRRPFTGESSQHVSVWEKP
jgi:2-polyprenyl-3-methyl-5-hydroxy-6-metoxy-1,4-benzoquinol methylase